MKSLLADTRIKDPISKESPSLGFQSQNSKPVTTGDLLSLPELEATLAHAGKTMARIVVIFSLGRLERPSAHSVSSAQRGLPVWLQEQEDRLER